ncbi:MAG: BON domain-containing protein [Candidatus Eremiobacteraeota bacterium]|nr:BON domain-containing protein [Candidatus Eremiobacteraeota bacterium]
MKRTVSAVAITCAVVAAMMAACSSSQQERAKSDVNDAFIAAKIHAKLVAIDPATVSLVTVDVAQGVVALRGQVHSQQEREKVDEAARSVSGVKRVDDRLTVNPKAPTANEIADDVSLQAKVKGALAAQTGVNALKVTVSVHAGVVALDGTYASAALHEVILETTRGVAGVRRVDDHLRPESPVRSTPVSSAQR